MKELLDKLKFNDWLRSEETAPYPSMFYDIPVFIQLEYIKKWLREVHKIDVIISHQFLEEDNSPVVYDACNYKY